MKRLTLIIILLSAFSVFSQRIGTEKTAGQVVANKSTVGLEYVCQDKEKVRLRMLNNTIWFIVVNTNEPRNYDYLTGQKEKLSNGLQVGITPNNKDIDLKYYVEKFALPWKNVKIPKFAYGRFAYTNWITSEGSILFSVPHKYLRNDLQIGVPFNYEWEATKNGHIVSGPEHKAIFRGIDIPTKTTNCEKQ